MTDDRSREIAFLLQRAEQECVFAILAEHPNTASTHYDLSLLYGELARVALREGAPCDLRIQRQCIPRLR
jgi:hypothetical protein